MNKENNRMRALSGIWYAAEKIDDVLDFVTMREKQKIRNIAKEFFRIEGRIFKQVKTDADMAQVVLINNDTIDRVVDLLYDGDKEKIEKLLDLIESPYAVEIKKGGIQPPKRKVQKYYATKSKA